MVDDVRVIAAHVQGTLGIRLTGGLGEGHPEFTERWINFNGPSKRDLGHETFVLDSQPWTSWDEAAAYGHRRWAEAEHRQLRERGFVWASARPRAFGRQTSTRPRRGGEVMSNFMTREQVFAELVKRGVESAKVEFSACSRSRTTATVCLRWTSSARSPTTKASRFDGPPLPPRNQLCTRMGRQAGGLPGDSRRVRRDEGDYGRSATVRCATTRRGSSYASRSLATITTSAGHGIPVRWVGEQHVREDLDRIPSAIEWLLCIQPENWMARNAMPLARIQEGARRGRMPDCVVGAR
jgi:hypothetical protein